ncbi:hypothetical protein E5C33_20800 [Stenotrophomonas maltophilia]|uniref:hypothetical protein n=1 Tax=Stenotrophomonas maltophilia TaxID=40324 RepID=UPI0010762FFC|nr:hypothetical protein [Stenotrophomonas maltophilia]TFZ42183.1 hypothetical protein E5C33_20800 [Stenotrophomonas maltophilia]
MRHLRKPLLILILAALTAGAAVLMLRAALLHLADGEWGASHEYSVLQGYEFRSRNMRHSSTVILEPRGNGAEVDVLGLPRLDQDAGYVWFVANPRTLPAVKAIPETASFAVSDDDLAAIKQRLQLDPRVESYLRTHRRHAAR